MAVVVTETARMVKATMVVTVVVTDAEERRWWQRPARVAEATKEATRAEAARVAEAVGLGFDGRSGCGRRTGGLF